MHETWLEKFEFQMSILWRRTKEISAYIREEWMCPSRDGPDSSGSGSRIRRRRIVMGSEGNMGGWRPIDIGGCVWLKSREGGRISWQEDFLNSLCLFFFLSQLLHAAVVYNNHLFFLAEMSSYFFSLSKTAGLRSICVHLPASIYSFICFHGWQVRSSSQKQKMCFSTAVSRSHVSGSCVKPFLKMESGLLNCKSANEKHYKIQGHYATEAPPS